MNALKIIVEGADGAGFSERRGTTKEGRAYNIRRQTVYMHNGKVHPTPVELNLGDDRRPYEPGEYTISASSFKLGVRGIEVDSYNMELVPLRSASAPAASTPRSPGV